MEITKEINISASSFYEKIINSVLFDIRKNTGKSLTMKQLSHFEYIKTFSKTNRAKIEIEKVVENSFYSYRTSTTKNSFSVSYHIIPIDQHSCKIHYEEKMESFGFLQKINDAVMGIALSFFKKRQFIKMLKMIESS